MSRPPLQNALRHGKYAAAMLACVVFACVQCGRKYTAVTTGVGGRYPGAAPLAVSAQSLCEGIEYTLKAFGDTLAGPAERLWRMNQDQLGIEVASSAEPDARNLIIARHLLSDIGYTVFLLSPASCEALHAISALPLTIWVVTLRFPQGHVEPMAEDLPYETFTDLLQPKSHLLNVHILTSTRSEGEVCEVATHDGMRWRLAAGERLEGRVFAAEQSHVSEYCQVVAHYGISRVALHEINAHLNEWFDNLPYTQGTVEARAVR